MGFRVEVLCYGKARRQAPGLAFFATKEELGKLLRKGRFEAVYSEYAFDARLARAGKARFGLEDFELGLAGSLRTAAALNGVCRWPFYRKYANYLNP